MTNNTINSYCPVCRANLAISPHHIIPVADGGSDDRKNKIYLCKRCHDIVEEIYDTHGVCYSPWLVNTIKKQYDFAGNNKEEHRRDHMRTYQRTYFAIRYNTDSEFRERHKAYMRNYMRKWYARKVNEDPEFRELCRIYRVTKYREDPEYRERRLESAKRWRVKNKCICGKIKCNGLHLLRDKLLETVKC